MPFELVEEVKRHPVPAALIAGGIVIGFIWLSGGFSGGQAPTSTGGIDPATAQLYAQANQLQAAKDAQTQQLQAQQNLATTQASYGLSLAQIQANAQTTNTNTAATVALAQIHESADTSRMQVAAQLQAAQDQYGVASKSIDAQLAALQDTNATTVNIAALTAAEQVQIANITGNTQIALSNNASQVSIANINASASVAKGAQSASTTNSILGMVGGLASDVIGGLFAFSDIRLKEKIRFHSVKNGFRYYTFRYKGDKTLRIGVLAHEVRRIRPEAVYRHPSGYDMVDYGMLS